MNLFRTKNYEICRGNRFTDCYILIFKRIYIGKQMQCPICPEILSIFFFCFFPTAIFQLPFFQFKEHSFHKPNTAIQKRIFFQPFHLVDIETVQIVISQNAWRQDGFQHLSSFGFVQCLVYTADAAGIETGNIQGREENAGIMQTNYFEIPFPVRTIFRLSS